MNRIVTILAVLFGLMVGTLSGMLYCVQKQVDILHQELERVSDFMDASVEAYRSGEKVMRLHDERIRSLENRLNLNNPLAGLLDREFDAVEVIGPLDNVRGGQ